VLLGYMGSGKSTIGRLLATKLDSKFQDLDNYIIGEIPLKSFWTIASDLD